MNNALSALQGARTISWPVPGTYSDRVTEARAIFGQDPFGMPLQVLFANWKPASQPTKDALKALFTSYRAKQVFPLIVTVQDAANKVWFYGPAEDTFVIGPIMESQALRILQACLQESSGVAARNLLVRYFDTLSTTAMPGVTNTGLFASHFLRNSAPQRADWKPMGALADPLLTKRGEPLIKGLGFRTFWEGSSVVLLKSDTDATRAVAVLLEDQETFNTKSDRFLQSPVSHGLSVAQAKEVPWLVALKGSQIRLYSAKANQGVGRKGQAETYLEIDLAVIDDHYKPLVPLIFSADALGPKGTTDEFLRDSSRFAVSLGKRLRTRVYEEVVPKLSVAVANEITRLGYQLDAHGLDVAYGATLRILFRLLFQAYGEDRALLPYSKNSTYDRHALKTIARELSEAASNQADSASDSYYRDLSNVWQVIDKGDSAWGVPAYNGGLFSDQDEEGGLLSRIGIKNDVFVDCLRSLLVDKTEDGDTGPVDFRSLSVREFGTIYEGLLESSLSLAETDLTLDKDGAWIPAKPGTAAVAKANEPYFHNASGMRKSTGSYFTPSFLVDHLLENSLVPALDRHLAQIREILEQGDQPKAAKRFFDFRVADLAMGSGHFLVSAIDQIETKLAAFLIDYPISEIEDELRSLERSAHEALGELSQDTEIEPSSLLRRQIARRCIYGLDINKIAVELARVAIWIHTFVPGLAMSSLDHGLVWGNSLTGIGNIDEALHELEPPVKGRAVGTVGVFRMTIEKQLEEAADLLSQVAAASEATAYDVSEAHKISQQAQAQAAPTKALFDIAIAVRLGLTTAASIEHSDVAAQKASDPAVLDLIDKLRPAHMPYLFPEVFLRDRPGFDVLIGNPPWEKVKVEEQVWWGLRSPRLRSLPQIDKNRVIKEMKESRPDLLAEYQRDIETADFLRLVVSKGPYPGIGSGDIDLHQAFAWRNYHLMRQGGYFGLVLPRGALAGSGTKQWRGEILDHAAFSSVSLLANARRWIFDDVDPRYNVGLVCVGKKQTHTVSFNGPFHSKDSLDKGKSELLEVDSETFKSWSSTYVFPWLPDEASVEVFLQLRRHPRFDSKEGFEFRPTTELHTTKEKRFYDFDLASPTGDIRVMTGGSFNLWDPDFGPPYAYAHSSEILPFLENKLANQRNNSRSAFYGLSDDQLIPRPWERARIAFRDVARSTDSRTVIAALMPPGIVLVEKAPFLFARRPSQIDEAYVLGIMSTRVFDWYARRFVELKLSFEILNPMPIPRPHRDDPLRQRVIEVSGRLAATDERFEVWASQVGVPVGSVTTKTEKDELIAELDAVVALLYGLTESQLVHIFETFHIGWDYEARLKSVISYFKQWSHQR